MKSPSAVIYNWSPKKYIKLVENTSNAMLREYEDKELEYITNIQFLHIKTVIDVGAGYGRILPRISPNAKNVVAIEINNNMFKELKRKAAKYPNVISIKGNANNLSQLLKGIDFVSPLILSLQNSFGTWQGDVKKAITEMKKVAQEKQGEIIISLHRQKALRSYGVEMYKAVEGLVGKIDIQRTNFEKGVFRSKTGYLSKWWHDSEIEAMIKQLNGKRVRKVESPNFVMLHVKY